MNAELSSWNDGPTKSAITGFVACVTEEGGPDYVEPAARVAVFGNDGTSWTEKPACHSAGDMPMLAFSGTPSTPSLRLLLLHDDADREFDYTAGAEQALELASRENWTVVSMKNDWNTVFADAT